VNGREFQGQKMSKKYREKGKDWPENSGTSTSLSRLAPGQTEKKKTVRVRILGPR
jgi:hypothetical protein